MLPRRYSPGWRATSSSTAPRTIAEQLCGEGMVLDFDQLLAKQPGRNDAVFGWHQDQAYWIDTDDRRTATCWLAVDDSTVENGCLQFLPGSHREPVRPHHPLHGDRGEPHPGDRAAPDRPDAGRCRSRAATSPCTARACLHGSGGNRTSDSWRRAYIVAFRRGATVAEERLRGFTHSHNDGSDVLDTVAGLQA